MNACHEEMKSTVCIRDLDNLNLAMVVWLKPISGNDQAQTSPEDQDKKSLPGFEPGTGGLGQERRDTKSSPSQLEDYKNQTCSKKQLVTQLHERLAQLS